MSDNNDEEWDETSATAIDYVRSATELILLAGAWLILLPVLWGVCSTLWDNELADVLQRELFARELWARGMENAAYLGLLVIVVYPIWRTVRCVARFFGLWDHIVVSTWILLLAPVPLQAVELTVGYVAEAWLSGKTTLGGLLPSRWNYSKEFTGATHPTMMKLGYTVGVEHELELLSGYRVRGYGVGWHHYRMGVDLTFLYLMLCWVLYGVLRLILLAYSRAQSRAALRVRQRARKIQ